jgi:hypothetical protein
MHMEGRCLVVSLAAVGIAALWVVAVGLVTWSTLNGPDDAGRWGVLSACAAAAWGSSRSGRRAHEVVLAAFHLGRDDRPDAKVTPLRR